MSGITVTDIVSEYGAYYINSQQNMQRLVALAMQPAETEKHMTPVITSDTLYRMANIAFVHVVQAFQNTFTAKGNATFTANPIQLDRIKVDMEVTPDDLVESWLGFLSTIEVLERANWPLVRWLMEVYLIPKIKEDIELHCIFWGVAATPGAGVAGAVQGAMTGIRKQLTDGVSAGTINDLSSVVGTLASATIFDQVEAFIENISLVYRLKGGKVFMAPEWAAAWWKDKRSQGFYGGWTSDGQISMKVDAHPFEVVGLPSAHGWNGMFYTPKENFLYLQKGISNKERFRVEEARRVVSIMTDWFEGVGFGINQAVWVAQANTGSGSGS
jgi:hypothetical protein